MRSARSASPSSVNTSNDRLDDRGVIAPRSSTQLRLVPFAARLVLAAFFCAAFDGNKKPGRAWRGRVSGVRLGMC